MFLDGFNNFFSESEAEKISGFLEEKHNPCYVQANLFSVTVFYLVEQRMISFLVGPITAEPSDYIYIYFTLRFIFRLKVFKTWELWQARPQQWNKERNYMIP